MNLLANNEGNDGREEGDNECKSLWEALPGHGEIVRNRDSPLACNPVKNPTPKQKAGLSNYYYKGPGNLACETTGFLPASAA